MKRRHRPQARDRARATSCVGRSRPNSSPASSHAAGRRARARASPTTGASGTAGRARSRPTPPSTPAARRGSSPADCRAPGSRRRRRARGRARRAASGPAPPRSTTGSISEPLVGGEEAALLLGEVLLGRLLGLRGRPAVVERAPVQLGERLRVGEVRVLVRHLEGRHDQRPCRTGQRDRGQEPAQRRGHRRHDSDHPLFYTAGGNTRIFLIARASLLSRSANGKGPNLLARHDQSARTLRIDDFEIQRLRRLLRHRRDRPQPPGVGREGAASSSTRPRPPARTRSSCRSATTARSTRASCSTSPYENENSYGATYGEHREALEFGKAEYEELKAYAAEIGHHVLLHRVRHPERRLPRRARHAGVQDRLRRPDQHAAAAARRVGRQADDPLDRRRDARRRPPRLRDGRRDQPAGRAAPVHGRLSGRVGGARPARHRHLPRPVPEHASSASPATTTASRWRSRRTCSARGSSRSTSRSTAR